MIVDDQWGWSIESVKPLPTDAPGKQHVRIVAKRLKGYLAPKDSTFEAAFGDATGVRGHLELEYVRVFVPLKDHDQFSAVVDTSVAPLIGKGTCLAPTSPERDAKSR